MGIRLSSFYPRDLWAFSAPWISGSHRMPAKRFSSRLTRWLGRTGTSFLWLTRRMMGRAEVKEEVLSRRSLAEIGLRNLASRILLRSLPAKTADAMAQFFSFEIKKSSFLFLKKKKT